MLVGKAEAPALSGRPAARPCATWSISGPRRRGWPPLPRRPAVNLSPLHAVHSLWESGIWAGSLLQAGGDIERLVHGDALPVADDGHRRSSGDDAHLAPHVGGWHSSSLSKETW